MIKDNPVYAWALSDLDNATQPDFIYFDDIEPEQPISSTLTGARLIIATIIEASECNINKLHALLAVFAGLSLREAGKLIGRSHEYVRLQVESIKITNPELYNVLTDKHRGKIESLIPIGKSKKWAITNLETKKTKYISSLYRYCQNQNLNYWKIIRAVNNDEGLFCGNKYARNY